MSFTIDISPRVEQALRRCSPAQQDFFAQVREILEENPYRFRDLIHRNIDGSGRTFYQYYDGIIPLVFFYRVNPAEEDWSVGRSGYVAIVKTEPPWW